MSIKVILILIISYQKIKKKFNYKQFELDNITSTKSDKLKLPKWIKVSKTRFNEIVSIITEAKNNGLKTNLDGEEITPDKAESKEKYNDIVENEEKILNKQPFTINEQDMINILLPLQELNLNLNQTNLILKILKKHGFS